MTVPTVNLNEATPDGGDYKREGDNRIREYKLQNREILEVDHVYPSSGQDATAGMHKQVTLIEAADIGTGAVGKTKLGSQTISGKGELVYTDEDDNDVQITSAGALVGATVASIAAVIYPVGALYITTVSTNPATVLGIGTWAAFGAGKVMVGLNAADADFDTSEETGGVKTVTLTSAQSGLVAHTHPQDATTILEAAGAKKDGSSFGALGGTTQANTAADAASSHTNVQPYIVVYMFKRTA